jgi:hypothetical protein
MTTEIERLYHEWLKAEADWSTSRDPKETQYYDGPLTKAVYDIVDKIEIAEITSLKDALYVIAVQASLNCHLYAMEGEPLKEPVRSYRRALAYAGIPLNPTEYGSPQSAIK